MWVVLAAIVMMFAALSSVYVMSNEEQRQPVAMPPMFFVSTGLILVSSFTFSKAKRSLQLDQLRAHKRWLLVTLVLGVGFLTSQLIGWRELANTGVYFTGHPRSTFFYLATALHGAHLVGGIGLVLYVLLRSLRAAEVAFSRSARLRNMRRFGGVERAILAAPARNRALVAENLPADLA